MADLPPHDLTDLLADAKSWKRSYHAGEGDYANMLTASGVIGQFDETTRWFMSEVERLRAENHAWAVRWQEQYDRAEKATDQTRHLEAEVERLRADNDELQRQPQTARTRQARKAKHAADKEAARLRAENDDLRWLVGQLARQAPAFVPARLAPLARDAVENFDPGRYTLTRWSFVQGGDTGG